MTWHHYVHFQQEQVCVSPRWGDLLHSEMNVLDLNPATQSLRMRISESPNEERSGILIIKPAQHQRFATWKMTDVASKASNLSLNIYRPENYSEYGDDVWKSIGKFTLGLQNLLSFVTEHLVKMQKWSEQTNCPLSTDVWSCHFAFILFQELDIKIIKKQ